MGKKKIVLDTNMFISALGWQGKPKQLLEKCIDGEFELIISSNQLDELMRVMDYPKFAFTEEQKLTLLGIITAISTVVHISNTLHIIKEDPDDNIILETAIGGDAEYIITGDPHLLQLKKFSKVNIMTGAEFLAMHS